MSINFQFRDQSDRKVVNFLRQSGRSVRQSVTREMKRITVDLQAYIKEYKLSGQVLHAPTGNLRRSIAQEVLTDGENRLKGRVFVQPNAQSYAFIHEYGGTIHVPEVSGPLMVFNSRGGDLVFTHRHKAFDVNMPERSYMRSSLFENQAAIIQRLNAAVIAGARGRIA